MSLVADFEQAFSETLKEDFPSGVTAYLPLSCLAGHNEKKVWLVQRVTDGKRFIFKLAAGEELQREFALLQHIRKKAPGLAPAPVQLFKADGFFCLVREYVAGQTLAELRAEHPERCDEGLCLRVGAALCDLLKELHTCTPPVICRDIKPENIVLCANGGARIIDYGIARLQNPERATDTRFLGTAATAAPEQYGFAQTDERTDLYALGRTLCWLLTGSYDRDALLQAPFSPQLCRVLRRCTSFSPDDRYPSAKALGEALAGKKRHWVRVWLAAAVLALGLFGMAAAFLPRLQQAQAVQFGSVCLEQAVRQELGRPEGPVTYAQLAEVKRLALVGEQSFAPSAAFAYRLQSYLDEAPCDKTSVGDVADLSLLAQMPNLKEVYLCAQSIESLEPLRGLTLTTLAVPDNQITSLAPLEGMTTLRRLYIGNNPIDDYSPLAGLTGLRLLNLDRETKTGARQRVPTLAPLEGLLLEELYLMRVEPEDGNWSFLQTLPRLQTLWLWNPDGDVFFSLAKSPVAELFVGDHHATDFSALAGLSSVRTLRMMYGPQDLAGIEGMTSLECLTLTNGTVRDLTLQTQLPHLWQLCLERSEINSLLPLREMPALREIMLDTRQLPLLQRDYPEHNLALILVEP